MLAKKHPFTSYLTAKTPKHSILELQTNEKNQWSLLCYCSDIHLSFRNKFANISYFAKISVFVESIIP